MSTRLAILDLLQDHPMYGYELKSAIETNMSDWTSIAFGSIYFALNKLSEEGLIEKVATEQEGNRPSRTIYEITAAGKSEFMKLLREQWQQAEREYYAFDIALFFQEYLSSSEIVVLLENKIRHLENILNTIENRRKASVAPPENTAFAANIVEHSLVHLKAELDWLRSLRRRFPGG